MAGKKEQLLTLVEPVAAELGLEVLDVEIGGSDAKRVLRIFLDRASPDGGCALRPGDGVTVADCEAVSRRVGDVLDAHEAVAGRYLLEVSSPGVNRPLRKPAHFRRVIGGKVRVRVSESEHGSRTVLGRLAGIAEDGETLTVLTETDEERVIGLVDIERANLEYEFPQAVRPGKRRR